MLVVIIFAVLGLFLGWDLLTPILEYRELRAIDCVMLFFTTFAGGGLGWLVALFIGWMLPLKEIEEETKKLVSLKNGTGINGTFYLMGGQIEGGWEYNYYERIGVNRYAPGRVAVSNDNIEVEEFEEGEPRLVVWHYVVNPRWLKLFGVGAEQVRYYQFFVPKGTVGNKIEI